MEQDTTIFGGFGGNEERQQLPPEELAQELAANPDLKSKATKPGAVASDSAEDLK